MIKLQLTEEQIKGIKKERLKLLREIYNKRKQKAIK